jgi:hypothetical protein
MYAACALARALPSGGLTGRAAAGSCWQVRPLPPASRPPMRARVSVPCVRTRCSHQLQATAEAKHIAYYIVAIIPPGRLTSTKLASRNIQLLK